MDYYLCISMKRQNSVHSTDILHLNTVNYISVINFRHNAIFTESLVFVVYERNVGHSTCFALI